MHVGSARVPHFAKTKLLLIGEKSREINKQFLSSNHKNSMEASESSIPDSLAVDAIEESHYKRCKQPVAILLWLNHAGRGVMRARGLAYGVLLRKSLNWCDQTSCQVIVQGPAPGPVASLSRLDYRPHRSQSLGWCVAHTTSCPVWDCVSRTLLWGRW